MVLVDLILAYDLLIYRKFDGSTFLAIPQSFFHHFGIPSWSWIAGFIFLVVGLYQYYAICSQNKAWLKCSAVITAIMWAGLFGVFDWSFAVTGHLPPVELHFCALMFYANSMLFLRYAVGFETFWCITTSPKDRGAYYRRAVPCKKEEEILFQ